jgi:N utilization substance protein A
MNKDLVAIFEYLEKEKGISRQVVINAIEESLQIAARKSVDGASNVTVAIDPKTGDIEVYSEKEIVEEVDDSQMEISLEHARILDPKCEMGQFIDVQVTPKDFGRIAAQKARQVITQKLKNAERDVIHEEYRHRMGELISGTVKRVTRGPNLIIDLGKVEGILFARHFPKTEKYKVGERVLALLHEVQETENGGAEVVLSRTEPLFIIRLFEQEVPEISEGTVTIERIIREPGYRTKVVVKTQDSRVDPVGACVGMRGIRVKNIVRELNNEKVDIIPYAADPIDLLQNALAPIEIRKISVNSEDNVVSIIVDDDDFAVVLGKRGLNAKLNGELIGSNLEVQKMSDHRKTQELQRMELAEANDPTLDQEIDHIEGINQMIVADLLGEQYNTPKKILSLTPTEMVEKFPGITVEMAEKIMEQLYKKRFRTVD